MWNLVDHLEVDSLASYSSDKEDKYPTLSTTWKMMFGIRLVLQHYCSLSVVLGGVGEVGPAYRLSPA